MPPQTRGNRIKSIHVMPRVETNTSSPNIEQTFSLSDKSLKIKRTKKKNGLTFSDLRRLDSTTATWIFFFSWYDNEPSSVFFPLSVTFFFSPTIFAGIESCASYLPLQVSVNDRTEWASSIHRPLHHCAPYRAPAPAFDFRYLFDVLIAPRDISRLYPRCKFLDFPTKVFFSFPLSPASLVLISSLR